MTLSQWQRDQIERRDHAEPGPPSRMPSSNANDIQTPEGRASSLEDWFCNECGWSDHLTSRCPIRHPELVRVPSAVKCNLCHILDGREPGRPVTAGCVHEHLSTLILCPKHDAAVRERTLFCKPCGDAGHEGVPVRVLTTPARKPS